MTGVQTCALPIFLCCFPVTITSIRIYNRISQNIKNLITTKFSNEIKLKKEEPQRNINLYETIQDVTAILETTGTAFDAAAIDLTHLTEVEMRERPRRHIEYAVRGSPIDYREVNTRLEGRRLERMRIDLGRILPTPLMDTIITIENLDTMSFRFPVEHTEELLENLIRTHLFYVEEFDVREDIGRITLRYP